MNALHRIFAFAWLFAPTVAWAQEEAVPPFDMEAAKAAVQEIDVSECGRGGRGRVTITFAADGTVTEAKVTEGTFESDTRNCVEGGFKEAHVPAFSGSATHTIGFVFVLPPNPPKPMAKEAPMAHVVPTEMPAPYAALAAFVLAANVGVMPSSGVERTGGLAFGPEAVVRVRGFEVGGILTAAAIQNGWSTSYGGMAGYALSAGPVDIELLAMYGSHQYDSIWSTPEPGFMEFDFGGGCTSNGASFSTSFVGARLGVARRIRVGPQFVYGVSLDLRRDLAVKDVPTTTSCSSGFLTQTHTSTTVSHKLGGTEVMIAFRLAFGNGW